MTAGDRFKSWIEGLSASWKDRLRGWMVSWTVGGIVDGLEVMTPEQKTAIDEIAQKLIDNPDVPEYAKGYLRLATERGNPLVLIGGILFAVFMIVPMVESVARPLGNILTQKQERLLRTFRLDPLSAITAWRRDPTTYAWVFDDLRDQGLPERTIETLKFVTQFLPSPRDLVDWQAKEVFEPEMIAKYGLGDEFETLDLSLFAKVGVTEEQARNFWMAHWEHASWLQVVEMLRRGQLKEEDIWDWFRLVEIPPFWRQKLINISWEVPTRVDVRRFWDMRTIDEARLREIYAARGYHGKDLEDYVLWTKVYVDFPTLLARWKNGWISLEEVKEKLVGLGMPADRVDEMLQEKIQAEGAERTSAERSLTLTDIYKGVKQGRITRAEAVGLVMDLGYDEDEAGFKLDVNVPSDETASAVEQRQLAKADILAGLKADIITIEGARQMLLQLRYAAVDVEFLLKLYQATIKPPTELKLKEASKADIVLGVKKGLITQSEGHAMLLDIGYEPAAADFILTVQTTESPFSPVTFDEFKDRTQKWRLAAGMEGKPMTEEIKKLGAEIIRLSADIEALQRSIKVEQGKLVPDTVLPAEATARVKELQATLYRVEAELARVQTDYRAKIVEWRHAAM